MESINEGESLARLDDKYEEHVRPYQTIVKTISLHNAQIYTLQQQYAKLQKQYHALKAEGSVKEQEIQKDQLRKRQLKKERNRFLEEALAAKQKQFDGQYRWKRMQRLQQIGLKYQQISTMKQPKSDYNIFFNLEQGLLQQVIHSLEGEQDLKKEIRSWLTIYKNSMVDNHK